MVEIIHRLSNKKKFINIYNFYKLNLMMTRLIISNGKYNNYKILKIK